MLEDDLARFKGQTRNVIDFVNYYCGFEFDVWWLGFYVCKSKVLPWRYPLHRSWENKLSETGIVHTGMTVVYADLYYLLSRCKANAVIFIDNDKMKQTGIDGPGARLCTYTCTCTMIHAPYKVQCMTISPLGLGEIDRNETRLYMRDSLTV